MKIDQWIWGVEKIVWGYQSDHQYTLKILEPKLGRLGCLSLQYHDHKSETWLVFRGIAWALLVIDGTVCTRLMRAGDVQNISAGVVHRLMAASEDLQVVEPSTPDAHAADKSKPKDVYRLHCVHGRPLDPPRSSAEEQTIRQAVAYTEEAIKCIEEGKLPPEHNLQVMIDFGGGRI